jgi:lantibiotic modifying enzyme
LYARAGGKQIHETALGAIRQALSRTEDLPPAVRISFYGGSLGIAYAAAWAGLLLQQAELVEAGLQLAARAIKERDEHHMLDVIGGNAGAIPSLAWMAQLPGGAPLGDAIFALADELVAAAIDRDGTWCWDTARASGPGVGATPLCGFAHGASGMGLALIEAGTYCHRRDWVDGGLAAFRYEDRLYEDDHGNWPDLREYAARDSSGATRRAASMVAWCHGAAGIGLARLRAHKLLPDERPALRLGIERAIHTVSARLRGMPPEADASPCHGRGGLAETLLYATTALDEPEHAALAAQTWRSVLRRYGTSSEWTCGVASGRNNPSLMLGLAGIGYALLRAYSWREVRSALVIETRFNGVAPPYRPGSSP